jgi:8-oxo-dGTP pyrophosphatase MutT (NUDIX family)|tara:strand:- start:992 stop:1525 length:534 start_codon:yes stop_codon:yes gene_type:complete
MVARWEKLRAELVADYRVLRVRGDRSRSPRTGAAHDFIVLEMADWVNVVPITAAGRVVMIRQYRHGTGEIGLEIPGGVIDPGEEPLAAARRELREETGYGASELAAIGQVAPNPALQDNRCYSFVARGAFCERAQALDAGEDIEVVEVEQREIPQLIACGEINHALVILALHCAGVG